MSAIVFAAAGQWLFVSRCAGQAVVRADLCETHAGITHLGWDTEGGDRAEKNLLRDGTAAGLRLLIDEQWRSADEFETEVVKSRSGEYRYELKVGSDAKLKFDVRPGDGRLSISIAAQGPLGKHADAIELAFPFNPRLTPTTLLAHDREGNTMMLPGVINSPDYGQMLLADSEGRHLKCRLVGHRVNGLVDLYIEIPTAEAKTTLTLTPVYLPPPKGLKNSELWGKIRRGWFGTMQPTAEWSMHVLGKGDTPSGLLANNVISDPPSVSVWHYADQMMWTPDLAPGVSGARILRWTVEYWMDEKTRPDGEVIGYTHMGRDWDKFMDANSGVVIASWSYVEATGDVDWLRDRMEKIEHIADYLAGRDIDGDGLVEATQSGNDGTLVNPGRSCSWWDAVNCGHKDTYANALTYRSWRCLAEMEGQLERTAKQAHYHRLADRLKAAFTRELYDPKTGLIGWWRAEDGSLHAPESPPVNGIAIEYGLVEPELGRQILERLWERMEEVGFKRFDLGVPSTLVPLRPDEYLGPPAFGRPSLPDGTDTFGVYMNGGITAGQVFHFLAAHYVVGMDEKGDFLLNKMIENHQKGGFQNGVQDKAMVGIDWTDWEGNPTGYEGYLCDSFRFLQAALMREPAMRARFYRPLSATAATFSEK